MSKSYSHYWVHLSVNELGGIDVRVRNTNTNKEIFSDNSYTFEHLFEVYEQCKKELLSVPELKAFVGRS